MKHRVRVQVPVEKRGLFGRKKLVYEERAILMDGRTYRRMQRAQKTAERNDLIDGAEILDAIFED